MTRTISILAALAVLFITTQADARIRHSQGRISAHAVTHVKTAHAGPRAKQTAVRASNADFSARRVIHRRHYTSRRGGGACDGFTRCRCGTTAARNFGIPYTYNGWNLKQANQWRHFPRTGFGIGVAGVQEHHVLKVVGGSSCSNATVTDDAGTYQRNVCNMTFHSVTGGGYTQVASHRGRTHTLSARSHRQHYAIAEVPIFDRHASK